MSNHEIIESDDMAVLWRKLSGKCARRTNMCGKCGIEYTNDQLKNLHFCKCGNPLYCMLEPANMDLGDIGFDSATQSLGGPCFRHMNEKQYEEFRSRNRGISMPLLSGRLGELQRSMMDDRKYGTIKEQAVLANVRLMELGQRLDQEEGSAAAWFKLSDLWTELQSVAKQLREMGEPTTETQMKKRTKLQQSQAHILSEIGKTITGGADREKTWDDILSTNDLVAKYKLQEANRRQQIGALATPEEIIEIISMVVLGVENAVTESLQHMKKSGMLSQSTNIEEVEASFISNIQKSARLTFGDQERIPTSKG